MKKHLLPLFALGMFLAASTLSSCSKDDDPGTEQPSSEFTYVEPYHTSGCDEATIQNFMASQKGYTFLEKQVMHQQLNVFLTVYSKGESSYRVYLFQQGLLSAAHAYEEIKHYSEVKKYLDEHYILVHEEETNLAYTIPAKTKLITLSKESDKKGFLVVTYTIGINPD